MTTQAVEKPVRMLRPCDNGVSFDKAFRLAKGRNARIISNKEADRILVETDVWTPVKGAFPIWTGTMTAYTAPGERFGSAVEYTDLESKLTWVLDVPAGFRKLKDSILVAEHPNYEFQRDGSRIVVVPESGKLTVVENFPTADGVYAYDENTRIPINQKMQCDGGNTHRHLWRANKRVAPIARGDFIDCDYYKYLVLLGRWPSFRHGVLTINDVSKEIKGSTGQ